MKNTNWGIKTPGWAIETEDGSWKVLRKCALLSYSFGWFATNPLTAEKGWPW